MSSGDRRGGRLSAQGDVCSQGLCETTWKNSDERVGRRSRMEAEMWMEQRGEDWGRCVAYAAVDESAHATGHSSGSKGRARLRSSFHFQVSIGCLLRNLYLESWSWQRFLKQTIKTVKKKVSRLDYIKTKNFLFIKRD